MKLSKFVLMSILLSFITINADVTVTVDCGGEQQGSGTATAKSNTKTDMLVAANQYCFNRSYSDGISQVSAYIENGPSYEVYHKIATKNRSSYVLKCGPRITKKTSDGVAGRKIVGYDFKGGTFVVTLPTEIKYALPAAKQYCSSTTGRLRLNKKGATIHDW